MLKLQQFLKSCNFLQLQLKFMYRHLHKKYNAFDKKYSAVNFLCFYQIQTAKTYVDEKIYLIGTLVFHPEALVL